MKQVSAYNYFGGKNSPRILRFIISKLEMIPVKHLAEPFCGSAAVSLNYRKASLRTINDLNSDIYNFFKVLRGQPEELIRAIELTPYSREEYESQFMHDAMEPVERARVFFLRTTQSYGNSGALRSYNAWSYTINDSRYGVSQSTARFLSKVEGLQDVVNQLRLIQVEHSDFRDFISRFDGPDTVFYVDPPYTMNERSGHIKYKHEINEREHEELAELLLSIKGKFLLSGYKSDLYDSLYHSCSRDHIASVKTNAGSAIETLWANYDLYTNRMFAY